MWLTGYAMKINQYERLKVNHIAIFFTSVNVIYHQVYLQFTWLISNMDVLVTVIDTEDGNDE